MYETSDFRKNLKIMVEGKPYVIVDFQHVKPGKGNQFTRTKLRNMLTSQNLEVTFKSGEKFEVPNVENKEMNFLYKDDSGFNFMSNETYDQIAMSEEDLGESRYYLTEGLKVVVLFYNDKAVAVDVPKAVNLKVATTDPGIKGDRVTGATKPAVMETGLTVGVPLHINEGDTLRIDTSTGEYVERVSQK
ncbi:elongation factor P [Bdellovibrio sp. SKB1291214]|uniref:elongation factor P n=1 Tax=Bdellovibrio sp. SKB1291214 TaxID=1732569 RepID=UPI000B51A3B1|nr:elongation factor P [Bdellovibrio sp. SKB1291214]UYL07601.1 elongation factor P [Bdellovibrio sp. SKB1291214]